MSNSFSLKKKRKKLSFETFQRTFFSLVFLLPPVCLYNCTTLKRYVFFERRIFHISGKEKRPSSYLQVEVKISRKRVVLRSKYVTRWKNREIGWGSRILSRARILKGPSEFLKTRVIDPLTSGAKKKKKKYSWTRNSSRLDIFARAEERRIDKLVDSFERVSIGCRI